MAGKRVSFASLANDPVVDEPGVDPDNNRIVDGPARWIPTENCRFNPRNPRDLGDLSDIESIDVSDLESIKDKQLQSCLAVTPEAYLKLWPEDEAKIAPVLPGVVVIINGNRRLAGAMKYGQPQLVVMVDDSHAESKAKLLRAALDENMARKDFDPIEEARGVVQVVSEYSTYREASEAEGWSPTWISQRKALLKLHPDLQLMVKAKSRGGDGITIRHARKIGATPGIESMDAAAQFAILDRLLDEEAQVVAANKAARAAKKARKGTTPAESTDAGAVPVSSDRLGRDDSGRPFSMENGRPESPGPTVSSLERSANRVSGDIVFSMENGNAAESSDERTPVLTSSVPTSAVQQPAKADTEGAHPGGDTEVPRPRSEGSDHGELDWTSPQMVADALCRNMEAEDAHAVAEILIDRLHAHFVQPTQ